MVWQINLFLALNSYTHKLIACIFLHPSPRSVPLPFIKCSQLLGKQEECNMQVDLQGWGAQGWRWVSCRCSTWSRCPSQSHRSWPGKSDNDARINYSNESTFLYLMSCVEYLQYMWGQNFPPLFISTTSPSCSELNYKNYYYIGCTLD